MANMTFKASLLPNSDLGYSLGSSDKRWKVNGDYRISLLSTSDWDRSVIALCQLSGTNTAVLSNWHGKLYRVRSNGLVPDYFADINFTAAYGQENGFFYSLITDYENTSIAARTGFGYRACVFKYNDKYYGGLEFSQEQAATFYIHGVGEFKPFAVTYYNYHGDGTIKNSEINDSLNYSTALCIRRSTNLYGNATTATKLSNTPNNTITFLRGDNTWTNILTGDIKLQATSGNSPSLLFLRDGGLTDWRIFVTSGKLSFQSAVDGATWTERAYFKDNSGDLVANSFTGNLIGNADSASRLKITSTDNAIARFDGNDGTIQNSNVYIGDNGFISIGGNTTHLTNGGTWVGMTYGETIEPESGIINIRGTGNIGIGSHCSYTNSIQETSLGWRGWIKNASNGYSITPSALILEDDGIIYYKATAKVYSKNEQITMTKYYVLHSGNYNTYSPTLTGDGASGIWAISITGNAATATKIYVTNTTPSSTTTYYPVYTNSTTSGNQDLRNNARFYYYDTGTTSYLNIGNNSNSGGLTLHNANGKYGDIVTSAFTANRTFTLPDVSGTIALTNHTHSYLPLSGGTLTGTLKIGNPSNNACPTVGIQIHDTRGADFAPNTLGKEVNFFFSNTPTPHESWTSGIYVRGWDGDNYAAWCLTGPASNGDYSTAPLYVRTSRNASEWGNYRKIYDTSNKPTLSELGASASGHNHDSIYKKIQTAVSSPSVSSTEIAFIDTISQDTQGKITVTKKTVRDASATQSGVVSTSAQTFVGNKTFNDAISVNANKYFNFYSNTAIKLINKDVNWNTSSYYEWVYLLIPMQPTANYYGMNYIDGTFYCWKQGGNVYDVVHVNLNNVWNSLEYYLDSYGQGTDWKLVTCTYNGIKYYALKGYYHANPYTNVVFSGHAQSDLSGGNNTSTKPLNLPYAVAYYNYTSNSANATVLNNEIYSSLSDTLTDSIVTYAVRRGLSNAGGFIGNASTASKWAIARTLTLTGSVTGSASIDGSGNVNLATTTNHTHSSEKLTDIAFTWSSSYSTGDWMLIHNGETGSNGGQLFRAINQTNTAKWIQGGASGDWNINSSTTTKLKTARNINGTSFNGTADITTANWGTARNISIADSDSSNTGTAVSVNGSGAVTLKLPSTIKATLKGNADTATALTSNAGGTEQPIYFSSGKPTATSYYLKANIANGTNYYQAEYSNNGRTIGAGSILRIPNIHYSTVTPSYTSGGEKYYKAAIAYIAANYGNAGYLVGTFNPNSQGPFFGHIYNVNEKDSETGLPRYSTFIFHNLSGGLESFGTNNYNYYYRQYVYNSGTWGISITGNAATATKLATGRTFQIKDNDGTNAGPVSSTFDGSTNLVINLPSTIKATLKGNADTADKWKTARTLTIGSTGKSVDGSGNVSWSHAEIGATVSNAWTGGTTAGPTIKTTVNGVTGTAVAIPSASASASGIITTGDQTISGTKTVLGNVYARTIWASANSNDGNEHQIGAQGNAGQIYLYSQGSTGGNRGLYTSNSSGTYVSVISLASDNSTYYRSGTFDGIVNVANGNPDSNSMGHGIQLRHDSEGGNITMYSGNCRTYGSYSWEIDAYNGNLRVYNFDSAGNYHGSVYIGKDNGVLYGACWNDYAEFRVTCKEAKPGQCVIENGDDTLNLSTKRCQPGAQIVSDTYGFAIGEIEGKYETPIAVSGRVLAYTDVDRHKFKPGQAVCSGPNGTVSRMRWYEKILWPERIIGFVSAIPEYEEWGNQNAEVKVNGRIWIKVK